jgi:hypothetical protein
MLNVLIHFIGDLETLKPNFDFEYTVISEMEDNNYSLIVGGNDEYLALEVEISKIHKEYTMIGAWNVDGSKHDFVDPKGKILKGYTVADYSFNLKPKKTFDSDGNLISEVAFSVEEAKTKQVNKYYGWADRQLDDDVIIP